MNNPPAGHNPYLEISRLVSRLVNAGVIPADQPDPIGPLTDRVAYLEKLANMKTEAQYRRNYDTGRYERYTRTVGEWVKD